MSLAPYYRTYTLAWEDDPDERQRLRKILRIGLIAFVVLGILIPLLPTPKSRRTRSRSRRGSPAS